MTLTNREISKAERDLLYLINQYRANLGAPLLVFDDRLNRAADDKVACFALNGVEPIHHTCAGENSEELRAEFGYTARGSEILCWSEKTAQSAFNTWRNSPVHDAVMRDPQYRAVGITGPSQAGKYWGTWVVEFGTEAPSKPAGAPATDVGARTVESRKETVIASFDSPISTIPAPLRTGGTIDRDTPIRLIGDCRKDVARGVLEYAKSPVMPEFDAVFAAISGHSIALLAIMAKETEYGRTANVRHNGWNTIDDPSGGFKVYGSWAEGARAAMRRFTDYGYKDGIYEPDITVAEFMQTWQGGPDCRKTNYGRCANGETRDSIELAITQFLDRANRIIKANNNTKPPTPTENPQFPPPTTPDPKPGKPVTFGRVPKPKNYSERIIAPGVNYAYDTLGARKPRGLILHRMIGTLTGTDSWFRTGAAGSALTDLGIGRGLVYRWTDPKAAIAPYASGPANGIDGDGTAFWNAYKNDPIGASIFNRDCESIEIEGLTYGDPVPDADYQRLVELLAWRADSWLKIPYNEWPLNNDGVHCLLGHSEVTDSKDCPGWVVYELVGQLIEDVRTVLKQYQTA